MFWLILASTAFIFHLIDLCIVVVPEEEIIDAFDVRIICRIVWQAEGNLSFFRAWKMWQTWKKILILITQDNKKERAFTKGFWGCGERFVIKATTWDPVYYLRTTHGVGSWGFPHMVSALYTSNFPQALSTRPLWGVPWREGEQRGERKERWLMNLSSASLFPCLLYLLQ